MRYSQQLDPNGTKAENSVPPQAPPGNLHVIVVTREY
jgi:hypothetical protein